MLDRRIGPATRRFAVLGESLLHTWSPYIHNSLFAAAGVDAVYLPITVPGEKLASAVDVFRSCFDDDLLRNCTMSHEESLLYINGLLNELRAAP